MNITYYHEKIIREVQPEDLTSVLQSNTGLVWVDMVGPSEEDVQVMRDVFRFHPLAVDDTINHHQRPRAEEFSDHLFIILNPIADIGYKLVFRELDIFVSQRYVVTVHKENESVIAQTIKRLDPTRLPGPVTSAFLLYLLLDSVLDAYRPIIDRVEEEINDLSNYVLRVPNEATLNQLFQAKRRLSRIWRALWPTRDVLNVVVHHNLPFIDKQSRYYLRDVADHLARQSDLIQIYGDNLNNLISIYTSSVSNQLNRFVNRLTIITIIFGAMTVISGFYGMNFEQTWPPFGSPWGIAFVLLLMASVCLVALVYLRKRG